MKRLGFLLGELIVLFGVLAVGCTKNDVEPENVFFQVYDHSSSDRVFYPVDFLELPDGGFYILGATSEDVARTWLSTYILRTDNLGEIIWDNIVDKPYMNPVANLMQAGDDVVFFCLDDYVQSTHVMRVNEEEQTASLMASMPKRIFPLAVSKTQDNSFLLLNYDRIARNTQLAKYSATFALDWVTDYNVQEDAEDMLVDHLTRTGRKLPFFTGQAGSGNYYANGLYNYSISTLLVESSGNKASIYYGYRYDGGIDAALPMSGSTFALSRFSYNEHYLLPNETLATAGIFNTRDLGGIKVAEIAPDSENHIFEMEVNGKKMLVFAYSTNSNQVGLLFYDAASGNFVGEKKFGFANPVRVSAIKPTKDGGLALLLETRVFGRFMRIALQKVPKVELENI